MRTLVCAAFALAFVGGHARAALAQQQPASLAAWLRGAYMENRSFIAKAAEQMPEANYGMRPGQQQEVRTFGQLVGHLANFNYLWCAEARGEKNPNAGNNFEKTTSKAALVKAIDDALAYCDATYASLTDASGAEPVSAVTEGGRRVQVPRMSILIQNYGHNQEHYGNIVTYMRIKNIAPPSSTAP